MSDNEFHKHLDECGQCRQNPFNLCPVGDSLLREVVIGSNESGLTPRAMDLLSAPACCASFVLDGIHHKDCRLAQSASH